MAEDRGYGNLKSQGKVSEKRKRKGKGEKQREKPCRCYGNHTMFEQRNIPSNENAVLSEWQTTLYAC